MTLIRQPQPLSQPNLCQLPGLRPGMKNGQTPLLLCLNPNHRLRMQNYLSSALVLIPCPLQALEYLDQDPKHQVIVDRCVTQLSCCRQPIARLQARIRLSAHQAPSPTMQPQTPESLKKIQDDRFHVDRMSGNNCGHAEDSYHEVTLKELAEQFKISPRQLNRLFHQAGCASPIREIRRRHLLEAYQKVLYSNDSLEKIAEQLDFYDGATFSRSFKRAFGFYPGHLRRSRC